MRHAYAFPSVQHGVHEFPHKLDQNIKEIHFIYSSILSSCHGNSGTGTAGTPGTGCEGNSGGSQPIHTSIRGIFLEPWGHSFLALCFLPPPPPPPCLQGLLYMEPHFLVRPTATPRITSTLRVQTRFARGHHARNPALTRVFQRLVEHSRFFFRASCVVHIRDFVIPFFFFLNTLPATIPPRERIDAWPLSEHRFSALRPFALAAFLSTMECVR
jgi:hypothetical protein